MSEQPHGGQATKSSSSENADDLQSKVQAFRASQSLEDKQTGLVACSVVQCGADVVQCGVCVVLCGVCVQCCMCGVCVLCCMVLWSC